MADYNLFNITDVEYLFKYGIALDSLLPCTSPAEMQHILFHAANACFLISYLAPSQKRGLLFMHGVLIIGFLIYSTWAWNILCAPNVFGWNFSLVILNMGQTLHILYKMRPVKLNKDLEKVYKALFEPLHVPRQLYKRLVSPEYAQIMSLHAGEAYAMSRLTKTDRLGLLFSGQANVISDTHFLHSISPMEFLDSPEFESSRTTREEKFKVSVVAATTCRYLFWQRSSLEYLFVKEQYLASIMLALIARDITTKLYSMNHKIVTEKGSNLDIRLPSLTSSLSSSVCESLSVTKSPARKSPGLIRKHQRSNFSPKATHSLDTSLTALGQSSQLSLTASPHQDASRTRKQMWSKRGSPYYTPPCFGTGVLRPPRKPKATAHSNREDGPPQLFQREEDDVEKCQNIIEMNILGDS